VPTGVVATLVVAEAGTPVAAVADQAATSQVMSAASAASAGIGLVNAERKSRMKRHTLHKLKRRRSPPC
jgi:hypothetical protein